MAAINYLVIVFFMDRKTLTLSNINEIHAQQARLRIILRNTVIDQKFLTKQHRPCQGNYYWLYDYT